MDEFIQFRLDVRYGAVTACQLYTEGVGGQQTQRLADMLERRHVHEIRDWEALFREAGAQSREARDVAGWVQSMLCIP
jgi:lipoate-protein ligase A